MAESATITTSSAAGGTVKANGAALPGSSTGAGTPARPSPSKPPLNQIHALPAPIRTFPLPAFYPSNPISLLYLVYAWLDQVFRPPAREPSVVHIGIWDPETRSVHVREPTSIRALWEQGFYGKGSLSRSEPNWLKRELARRGSPEGKTVSEARTELRREERRLAKWERAKAELEAIERQRHAEAAAQHARAEAIGAVEVGEPGKLKGAVNQPPELVESVALSSPPQVPDGVLSGPDAASQTTAALETFDTVKLNGSLNARGQEFRAPVGPAELLALPNSLAKPLNTASERPLQRKPPVGPAELLLLPNSLADLVLETTIGKVAVAAGRTSCHGSAVAGDGRLPMDGDVHRKGQHVGQASAPQDNHQMAARPANGILPNGMDIKVAASFSPSDGTGSSPSAQGTPDPVSPPAKRRKSVRFSPTVESTTFQYSDPPRPNHSVAGPSREPVTVHALPNPKSAPESGVALSLSTETQADASAATLNLSMESAASEAEIENKEHFQLSPEEAFFLVFSLGALRVVDPVTGSPIPTDHLLSLFRSHSYFPPRPPGGVGLGPDDPFLVHYAVYHHFRSLGWVPRHGVKFGVDWILYQRGPVFDHSEFGIMVMPSYSDPRWEEQEQEEEGHGHGHGHREQRRSWAWLMGVNRVLSHVLKSLVLVYVDIPPPPVFEEEMRRGGIAAALKRYTIREVMVRRFSVNRNR